MMASYQELGAEKGATIQTILKGLGFEHMNQVTGDKYVELFNQIETLKKA